MTTRSYIPSYFENVYVTPIKSNLPVACTCSYCRQSVVTRIEKESGSTTWSICAAICFLGAPLACFLGCCLIPFCISPLKDTVHYCPRCSQVLGRGKPCSSQR